MFQLLAHVAASGETGLISQTANHTPRPQPSAAGPSTEYLTGRNPTCLVGREREREGERERERGREREALNLSTPAEWSWAGLTDVKH